ncbi:serine protease [Aurantimonas sp. HBX-1]|uniref:trypsin-like serine peptidase n=1 Tax=Aurantimonas sp. HBX-1 TaxID=2906072 RepID=UPI001F28CEFB|nr:serine protease [Aurantimonas sp. HBX-1]UIJ70328.1 trypsin-like peptidase domain-containing protein [Aurantimonas sp. HBX-1]
MATDAELRSIAEGIRTPEPVFAEAYEEVRAAHGGGSLSDSFMVLKIIKSPGELLFEKVLKVARDRGWLEIFLGRLAAVVDGAEDRRPSEAARVTLQAILNPGMGLPDASSLNKEIATAVRRLCRITVTTGAGHIKMGTGFLVGPQAVLTAGHLVTDLVDAAGQPLPDVFQQVEVTFDHFAGATKRTSTGLAEDWLIGFSKVHPSEQPGASILDFERADPAGFDAHLDYAALRLASTVGGIRGYYRLERDRLPRVGANETNYVLVLQHPGGHPLKYAHGQGTRLWPDTCRTRLHHNANAMVGSSGGLILDAEHKPVALHQCGISAQDGTAIVNGAIPTACIAAANDDTFMSVVGFDPIFRTVSGQPVIGREEFQRKVLLTITGEKRILVVRGAEKTGKTFSTEIMNQMLGGAEHKIVALSASELPADASALAALILTNAGVSDAAFVLPKPEDSDTARYAWIRDKLVPALVEKLRAEAGSRVLWLIIDDLEKHFVPETSARVLLERLYHDIGLLPFLRICLIGLSGAVPAAPPELVADETTRSLDIEEIADYLNRRVVDAGAEVLLGAIEQAAKSIINDAAAAAGPQVENVAQLAARRAAELILGDHR